MDICRRPLLSLPVKVSHAENERMQTDKIGVTNTDTIDLLYMN